MEERERGVRGDSVQIFLFTPIESIQYYLPPLNIVGRLNFFFQSYANIQCFDDEDDDDDQFINHHHKPSIIIIINNKVIIND